jgi:hypothetical protein
MGKQRHHIYVDMRTLHNYIGSNIGKYGGVYTGNINDRYGCF